MIEFVEFPKIPRLYRDCVITEKIDGTNACVVVPESNDEPLAAQSRKRVIPVDDDAFGFLAWVREHEDELRALGPGHHFGEWHGPGIQRGYGLPEKRFALFNVKRWGTTRPSCCWIPPVIYEGPFDATAVEFALQQLRDMGTLIPGADRDQVKPEGVVIYHAAANMCFKVTLENDQSGKEHGA